MRRLIGISWALSLLAGSALAADAPPGESSSPLSPADGLASMVVRPGFQIELVAAEPLVMDPVAFDWGPDGKLWVVEMADYPLGIDGHGKFGGRVRYLEDSDGDGRYDRSTVFLDELGFPTGVMPWRRGVFVTCAPDILYAEDTNADGRADIRQSLYAGFREGNQQHRVNGLQWGLDNWIHCANGDSGGKIESRLTGERFDISGRDFRFRPDRGLLDPQTGVSQFTRVRDDWGNWFGTNNSHPLFHFVLPDEYLRRNPRMATPRTSVQVSSVPGAAPVYPVSPAVSRFNDLNMVNRFTSACGEAIYRDELFGPDYAGASFVCEPVHNLVHRETLSPDGVTFTSRRADDEQTSEFLASTDPWCRPVTARVGPDGALWIADMYRQVIEHPQWIPKEWLERLDLRAGHDKGRIYRVFPVGRRPRPVPRLDRLETPALVAALDSPSGRWRDVAQQLLVERQDRAAIDPLKQLLRSSQRPQTRLQALGALDGLDAVDAEIAGLATSDEHPALRRQGLRVGERLINETPSLGEAILKLAADPDPSVRLQAALSLGQWRDDRAGPALGRLAASSAGDPFIVAGAMSSLGAGNLAAVVATIADRAEPNPPAEILEKLTGMAVAINDRPALEQIVAVIVDSQDAGRQTLRMAMLRALLDAIDERRSTLAKFLGAGEPPLPAMIGPLNEMLAAARRTAADPQAKDEDRALAIAVLGRDPGGREADLGALGDLLAPQSPPELQRAAAAALARINDAGVPDALLSGWKGSGPELRGQILDALLARDAWIGALLDSVERGDILPAEFDAARVQRLTDHKQESVRCRAAALLAGARNADRQRVVDEYRDALTLSGDPTRGQQVFQRRCSACHKLGESGHAIGPDLAAMVDKSPGFLLTSVLDPNRAVEARYISYTAITTSGLAHAGMLSAESGASVTLVGPEGKEVSVLRADLESLISSSKSLMPEGLEKDLSRQDLADVFAALGRSAPPRKVFPGNRPEVARPEALRGELYLAAQSAEIYGPTLVLEDKHKNLGYWQSENDHAVWKVEITQPGKYEVALEYACPDDAAGNAWLLNADGERLTGKVASTGGWDAFRLQNVGRITLDAGRRQVDVRASGRIRGSLMDLKTVRLRPVARP